MDKSIGRCEGLCGLVDHHLVRGLCETCRNDDRIHDCEDDDGSESIELGVECALPKGYRVGDSHPAAVKHV